MLGAGCSWLNIRPALFLGSNLLVAGGLLAWLAWQHGRPALAVLGASPDALGLIAAAGAAALALAALALRWHVLLAGFAGRTSLSRLVAFRAAGQAVGAVVPSARLAGDPLRIWLLARARTPPPVAIASVAIDRALELGSSAGFTVFFALVLVRQHIPALQGAVTAGMLGGVAVLVGLVVTAVRLRRHAGLVTALLRAVRLDRLRLVRSQMRLLEDAEAVAQALVDQPRRLARAFGVGVLSNALTPLEYWLLLSAFGLPSEPVAVVGAVFATGAAHSMPVPAGVGVLEGAQVGLFVLLGFPPDVGMAVGLAVRLRELFWVAPGLGVLALELLRQARPAAASRQPATDS